MGAAMSIDITNEITEFIVNPKQTYTPTILSIRAKSGTVEIHLDDDQLAEMEFALRTYLDGIRYPETPDQQAILNHEINQSIEEGIA